MDFTLINWIIAIAIPLGYVLGAGFAIDAILKTRTPQGATAWALALVLMPFLALPVYWVFGRARFNTYIRALRQFDQAMIPLLPEIENLDSSVVVVAEDADDGRMRGELLAFERLSTITFTRGNQAELLTDGEVAFEEMLSAIDEAREYVLAQFYIVRDDSLGSRFADSLKRAAARGVQVYFLFDEVGSYQLGRSFKRELRRAGVNVAGFSGNRRWLSRFRLNFRNHRKILVVDGQVGFMGGLNVGDEYLGLDQKLTPWRDTHMSIKGRAVQGLQVSFSRDWYYGHRVLPDVTWPNEYPSAGDQEALILASGPVDELETCGLLFTHAIESAEQRVWIASPYFVPDGRVLGALQLAALRGVDVRIIMPRMTDNILFKFVPYAFLPDAERAGVKVYLYEEGFMHQKVFLVDHEYGAVSTANFDNRSFLFNFEITCLLKNEEFNSQVGKMLAKDLEKCTLLSGEELANRSPLFHVATNVTRLFAPVL